MTNNIICLLVSQSPGTILGENKHDVANLRKLHDKGNKYLPVHVNKLYSMCKKHLTGNFNFICFADCTDGFHKDIILKPLPDYDKTYFNLYQRKRMIIEWPYLWLKLKLFEKGFLQGDCLFVDLDVIIHDNLDCVFEFEKGSLCFSVERGPLCYASNRHPEKFLKYNGGFFRFNSERHHFIWDIYSKNKDYIHTYYNLDDEAVTRMIRFGDKECFVFPTDWYFYYYERLIINESDKGKRLPVEKPHCVSYGNDDRGIHTFETTPPPGSKFCHLNDPNVRIDGREPDLFDLLIVPPKMTSVKCKDHYFLNNWNDFLKTS